MTAKQLKICCENIPELEKNLHCKYEGQAMTGKFLDIVKKQVDVCEKDPENYLWHSFWLIIRKSDKLVVGSCGFKNKPNKDGEVEIGYGLGKVHERNGYMTECVKKISSWALNQQGIRSIIAETEADNLPSQKVLSRCGFKQYDNKSINLWWRL